MPVELTITPDAADLIDRKGGVVALDLVRGTG